MRVAGCGLRVTGYGLWVVGCELRVAGCELRGAGGGRVVGGGAFDTSAGSFRQAPFGRLLSAGSFRQAQDRQYKQAQDKFFVFSLTIATILYKYMHIYLWTALRIVVFERGICGF